ncbi:hypothetical protein H257_15981 [Aphanomyces astaci]|uniref:Uncharacterized protein n=1 Tax=Aphanomyces astaci TaxID=112090 RepID=W4FK16_APHAT|nr:hypothetical protein H257_15981 [Aphanomyces astaci]ETV67857.1 hypothetical protein H257_15981 [Aphanomyces astaci]|eukprot:XP_009842602.1 hypothetical protein H257_15981 [Aphanomyces astaci]
MVATRATRQENPRALPTSVTEPVVDMSDADMDTQLDADDALIDGDVPQDVDMDADPPVTARVPFLCPDSSCVVGICTWPEEPDENFVASNWPYS